MIEILHETDGKLISTKAVDKLTQNDYDRLIPLLESKIKQHDNLNWYFEMQDFKGWEPKALWEDLKFDAKHANDFDKIAMVGEKK